MYSCTVSGSQIFWMELKSPLLVGVGAAITIPLIVILIALRKGFRVPGMPQSRRASYAVIVGVILSYLVLVPAVTYNSVRPSLEYGIWISDSTARVRFYEDKIVEFNLCNTTVNLIGAGEALDMLKVRTNGLSDPTVGVHMGYYRTRDGAKAYVLALPKLSQHALVAKLSDGSYVILVIPHIEEAYSVILNVRAANCSAAAG